MGVARRSGRCLAVAGLLLTTALAGCTSARQAPARPASDGLGVVAVPERSGTFDVLGYPQLVAAGAGAVWVLCPPSPDAASGLANQGALLRIDPDTVGRPVVRFGGLGDGSLAVGEGAVWITNRTPGTVTRIDTRSGQPSGPPIRVGDSPKGIAVLAGSAWVANSGSRSVTRLSPP
jgi:DNA-binding beta-propeller fold protein YncE